MREKYTVVLGLGISGKAALAFLLHRRERVIGVDRHFSELPEGAQFYPDQNGLLPIPWVDVKMVIVSPGIPSHHPLLRQALKQGIEVVGEVEFACRHLSNRVVGVTGSNGKTTTTLLITHVLNFSGVKTRALGNVGVGLSTYLIHPDPDEIIVLELSSFQLETLRARCLDWALVINISPNHLDRHPSMEEYAMIKLSICNCLKEGGELFVGEQVMQEYPCRATVYDSLLPRETKQNLRAAFAICSQFGITEKEFYAACLTFCPPPHRMEKLSQINGVTYYNDSKSSNVESVMHAVRALQGPIVLIVGGTDKGTTYVPWISCFQGQVKQIVAYGVAREKIAKEMGGNFPIEVVELFADAVKRASSIAQEGDTVLLSPGCSSYDQFRNFEHRGDVYRELLKTLKFSQVNA